MKRASIKCSSCNHENFIPIDFHKECEKCNSPLFIIPKKSKFTRNILSLIFISTIASGSYILLNNQLNYRSKIELNRYPTNIEFELIDKCLNSSNSILDKTLYSIKRDICFCALNNLQKYLNFDGFQSDKYAALTNLNKEVNSCLYDKLPASLKRRALK